MNKYDVVERLFYLGEIQIKLRGQIGRVEEELKELKKELRENEKEVSALRSTKEYNEVYPIQEVTNG